MGNQGKTSTKSINYQSHSWESIPNQSIVDTYRLEFQFPFNPFTNSRNLNNNWRSASTLQVRSYIQLYVYRSSEIKESIACMLLITNEHVNWETGVEQNWHPSLGATWQSALSLAKRVVELIMFAQRRFAFYDCFYRGRRIKTILWLL